MKKLFVFDMDGTILNDKEDVRKETEDALDRLRKEGHIAIIASGRPFKDIVRSLKEAANYFKYFICNNGAYVSNVETEEKKHITEISSRYVDDIYEVIKDKSCFLVAHSSKESMRAYIGENKDIEINKEEYTEFSKFDDALISIKDLLSWSKENKIFQISVRSTASTIKQIMPLLESFKSDVSIKTANQVYIDANAKGVSKWEGIKKISQELEIKNENVVAFGDSGNDVEMLENVGLGICLENGTDEAKSVADVIIGDNNSDAIAKKVLELIK